MAEVDLLAALQASVDRARAAYHSDKMTRIHDGEMCAVCEAPFTDDPRPRHYERVQGVMVHDHCWDTDVDDPRIADAEYQRDHAHHLDASPARWEP